MKEADIDPLTLGDLLRYLGLWMSMPPSSIQSRWALTSIDLNSVVDILVSTEKYMPPSHPWMLIREEQFWTI